MKIQIPSNAVQLRLVNMRNREPTTLSFVDRKGTVCAQLALTPKSVTNPVPIAKDVVKIQIVGDESIVLKFDEYP